MLALLSAMLAGACEKHYPDFSDDSSFNNPYTVSHEQIVLGEKLDDPYTVENMTKALASLYPTKAGRIQLETTDLYVRFLPKDENDCKQLEALGADLLDHPLDYSIVQEGDWYHDPEIDEEEITWQYAVVDKDFKFPTNIKYEILDKCYLAEHDEKASFDGIDWEAVERQSFELTGNSEMIAQEGTKGEFPTSYPEGHIKIVDDKLGKTIGVAGVKVQCNCFVKFANTFTDEDGHYKMGRHFSSKVRYRLVFANKKGFRIGFNLILVPASFSTLGKNTPEGLSVTIDKNSNRLLFARCVVNNAGYEYYSKCKVNGYSISTPPANLRIWIFRLMGSSSAPMLQQGAVIDGTIIGEFLGGYSTLVKMFLPDITLGIKDYYDYESIFNVTVHEMAHASHFAQVGTSFWNTYIKYILFSFVTSGWITYGVGTEENHGYCEVGEMWAYYVSSILNRERYDSDANYGGSFWFSPQKLLFLDNRGMDRFKIFKALTPNVNTVEALQDKLIELYPESKSTINQAFNRYE